MLEVTRSAGFFTPNVNAVRVNQRYGLVYLMAGGKVIEMRTPAAHKTGFALVKQAGEALHNEFIILETRLLRHECVKIWHLEIFRGEWVLSKRSVSLIGAD